MKDFDLSTIDLSPASDMDRLLSASGSDVQGETTQQPILQRLEVASADFESIQVTGSAGLDALFQGQPQLVNPSGGRKRVASLQDLRGFTRISAETLVHKSNNDLWTLKKESDGKFYIERLFDDNGEPLKG